MTDDLGERTEIAVPRLGPALIALTVSRKPDHVLRGYDESQVPEGHRSWRGVPAVRRPRLGSAKAVDDRLDLGSIARAKHDLLDRTTPLRPQTGSSLRRLGYQARPPLSSDVAPPAADPVRVMNREHLVPMLIRSAAAQREVRD